MMELRSRSRSKTPLLMTRIDKEIYNQEDHVETVVRTTRSSATKTMESHKYKTNARSSKSKTVQRKNFTSDYSSEDGDYDSTSNTASQNMTNQYIEDNRNNHHESDISALKVYKEAGEYWNKYPKTDYTYSRHSKDRIELAPGVVAMPNMSRRSLHTYEDIYDNAYTANKHTNTECYQTDSNTFIKPRALFTNNHHDDGNNTSCDRVSRTTTRSTSVYQKITRTIVTMITAIFNTFYYAYRFQRNVFVQIAKWIHAMTSVVMLMDTRLLRRSSMNRNNRKMTYLLSLMLVPLLLLAGWWLTTGATKYIYDAYKTAIVDNNVPPATTTTTISNDAFIDNEEYVNNEPSIVEINYVQRSQEQHRDDAIRIDTDELMRKILNSPKIQEIIKSNRVINNKIDKVTLQLQNEIANDLAKQQSIVDSLRDENQRIRLAMAEQASVTKQHLNVLLNQMELKMNKCCTRSLINIEGYVLNMLKKLFSMPDRVVSQDDAQSWLRSLFIAKNDLEIRIDDLTKHLNRDFNELIAGNTNMIMADVTRLMSKELSRRFESVRDKEIIVDAFGEDRIKEIVSNALAMYDADKTGLVDYAMEPSGGQIISTRCTEAYNTGTAVISILGIGLWNPINTPRTVITPGNKPGECWAFQNFPGYLLIKLVQPIRLEMFSYEHLSKLLVPDGRITSAPKEFSVFGLRHERDKESVEIGRYVYDINGTPLQYFPTGNSSHVYQIIELIVHNNNGNPNYTCLYRFRVHGTPASTEPT